MKIADQPFGELTRLSVLRGLNLLDTVKEPALDALTAAAALALDCEVACISLIDENRQWFKSHYGTEVSETPRDISFCAHAILGKGPFIVEDARKDDRFFDNPLVVGAPHIRLYIGIPLSISGVNIGSLCVLGSSARTPKANDVDVLRKLAFAVESHIQAAHGMLPLVNQGTSLLAYAQASADWLWECDNKGRITWSSLDDAMSPPPAGPAQAQQPAVALGARHLDGKPVSPTLSFRELVKKGQSFQDMVFAWKGVGPMQWVHMTGLPSFSSKGVLEGFRGTAVDITATFRNMIEAEQAKDLIAQVSRNLPGFVFNVKVQPDRSLKVEYVGDGARDILGTDFKGTQSDVIALVHKVKKSAWFGFSKTFLARQRKPLVVTKTIAFINSNGVERSLQVHAKCALHEDGSFSWDGFATDQVEFSKLMQAKRREVDAMRLANERSKFLSTVSHELRTPLNGILGFSQLLLDDPVQPLAEAQRRKMEIIHGAGRRLAVLIDDVLDMTRIDQGERKFSIVEVDITAMLRDALTIVEPDALKMGVELSFVNSNVAIHAKADRRAVDQILLNLLSNAIKYNRPHGQVFIQCEVSGSQVVVSVRDEGMGMTPKQLANLFQRFNRLGAEASSKPGHGLGLVISKGLAQAMGGELTASSVEQQGTTLVLTLQSCEAATGGAQSPVDRSTWPAQVAGRALKVLYVEDDEVNALLMTEVLRFTPDVAVEVAVTGAAGLALAEVMAPDLIFVDMNLPDMSGLDVVRKVRRLRVCRNTRIIGLSADGEDRTRAAASNAGCDEYWLKPLDLRRIPQVLNTVRGRP